MTPSPSVHDSACATAKAQWLADEVQPHEPALRGYLRHQFPSVDADDVVQESYLKMLKAQTAGKIESAKAYFFSVARNTALKVFRRRKRFLSPIPVNELPEWRVIDGGPDAADVANASQRLELVATAVDQLPPRCRAILRLAIVHGRSTAEIAKELALSPATVRVQMARGIARCASFIREEDLT
ncbi:MAG: sigma-70 family RNA polymerase sigma factor [Opitutaceae bacterium]|nr:sigma-70 family RNA polymerase sigma factor [Opitutaceae bacterium]